MVDIPLIVNIGNFLIFTIDNYGGVWYNTLSLLKNVSEKELKKMDLQKGDIVKLSNTRWKCNSKGTWLVEKTPYEAGWNEDGYVLIRIKRDGGVYQDSIVIIDNLNEHYIKVDKVKVNQYMKSGAIAYFRWVADVYKRRITQNANSKQDTFNECQNIIDLNLQTIERLCKVA